MFTEHECPSTGIWMNKQTGDEQVDGLNEILTFMKGNFEGNSHKMVLIIFNSH